MKTILRSNSPVVLCLLAGVLFAVSNTRAQLPNAWQITDNTNATGSTLSYSTNLSAVQHQSATNSGFDLTVHARFVTDFSGSKTMNMSYGLGTNRFLIWWELNASGNLTAELEGGNTYTLTTNGTGVELYHSHKIIYNPTDGTASYVVDGQVKTNGWKGSAVALTEGRVSWGAGSSGGEGQMNFRTVTFTITGLGIVAAYDADTAGNPAAAPDPSDLGWTFNSGMSTTATNISPDNDLAVSTLAADQWTNTSARLNGLCNPLGLQSIAWFEWGANTSYGNVTAPQMVGSGFARVSISNVLGSLNGGPDYHFRLVTSNVLGVVAGADQSFNLRFLEIIVPGLPGVLSGSVAWGDADNNGWLDFLLTGAASGVGEICQLWSNTGNGFVNSSGSSLTGVVQGSDAWGDYNNDGFLDFLHIGNASSGGSGGYASQLWANTGGAFVNVTAGLAPGLPDVASGSVVWGDYDNDGRQDFLLMGVQSSGPRVTQLWRNTGSGFVFIPIAGLPNVGEGEVAWGDYDNDGRLDFLLTGFSTGGAGTNLSQLWRNTGFGFSHVTASVAPGLPAMRRGSVAWGDYDNDGWLDFLLAGSTNLSATGMTCQLWRNTGSGFTNVPNLGLPGVFDGSVAWGDYDNDGRLDLLLTSGSSPVWRNTGSGFANVSITSFPNSWSTPVAWGDYDSDGRLDFLVTALTATGRVSQLWRNNSPGSNTPPTTPTGLSMALTGPHVTLSWNPASDAQTPAAGLTYNLRIGTTPGSSDALSPMSLANGHRLLPQAGNAQKRLTALFKPQPGQTYYWSVQAVDTAFAGSPFSAERNFTVSTYFAHTDGTPVFGDSNGDRVVDQSELNTALNNYWQTSPPNIESVVSPSNTLFQFGLTNLSSLNLRVLASTNVALPLIDWTDIGPASLIYKFTDPEATNYPARFYRLEWP